jgi:hypothetical protein
MGSHSDETKNGRASMTTVYKFMRAAGMFLGNLGAAVIGTTVLEAELYRIFPTQTPWGALRKETILSALVAFGLGYFVYYKWRLPSSKWVFVAGLTWFGWGALSFWLGQRNLRVVSADHSIYWQLSGIGCKDFDPQSCLDYMRYTVLLLRTFFYSAGALVCSRFGTYPFAPIEDALLGPVRLVDPNVPVTATDDPADPRSDSRLP